MLSFFMLHDRLCISTKNALATTLLGRSEGEALDARVERQQTTWMVQPRLSATLLSLDQIARVDVLFPKREKGFPILWELDLAAPG
jgi:hypothetical protein